MILDSVIHLIDKTVDRFVPDKNVQRKLKNAFRINVLEMAIKERELMQQFFLEYEGRARELPRGVQLARALIRPFFTWALGLVGMGWIIGQAFGWIHQDMPNALQMWVSIVLGFWFGGRVFEKWKNGEKA